MQTSAVPSTRHLMPVTQRPDVVFVRGEAGLAVVHSLLEKGFLESVEQVGMLVADGLRDLSARFGLGEVRGQGLLLALELGRDSAPDIVQRARKAGLLLNAPRPHCLRFMPALNTKLAEVDEALAILRQVVPGALREAGHG